MTGLRALVQKALSLPDGSVRFANEPYPSGLNAFVTLEHHMDSAWGPARRSWKESAEESTVKANNQAQVTVNAYGAGSVRLLNKLKTLLSAEPAIKSELRKLEMGLLRQSEVRNISALAVPTYEERAVFELEFTYSHVVKTSTKRIDVVEVQINSDPGKNPVTVNIVRP